MVSMEPEMASNVVESRGGARTYHHFGGKYSRSPDRMSMKPAFN